MTNKEKREAEERKQEMYVKAKGKCEVCGQAVPYGVCQLAHRIPKHQRNLKKYGKEIIHNPLNMAIVCSLACNAKVMKGSGRPLEAEELAEKIRGLL